MKIGTKTVLTIVIVCLAYIVAIARQDVFAGIVVMLFIIPVAAS
jgi:hypothetical protein